jgi:hypothetical protein
MMVPGSATGVGACGSGRPFQAVRAAALKYVGTIGIRRDAEAFPSMLMAQ